MMTRFDQVALKAMQVIGVILIVMGILALVYRRVSYTSERRSVSIDGTQAQMEVKKIMPLPPLFGALTVLGGVILVIAGRTGPRTGARKR